MFWQIFLETSSMILLVLVIGYLAFKLLHKAVEIKRGGE